jgi:hypothetical protein
MHCADVVLIGRSTCEDLLVAETGGLPPEALRSRLVTTTGWIEGHPDGVFGPIWGTPDQPRRRRLVATLVRAGSRIANQGENVHAA